VLIARRWKQHADRGRAHSRHFLGLGPVLALSREMTAALHQQRDDDPIESNQERIYAS
jgi:hypothetical protein